MSDDPEAAHERAAVQHMMRRLDGFARGLGLDEATMRQIVERVAAEMLMRTDKERLIEARTRIIEASV
jgi:hypothetical protein